MFDIHKIRPVHGWRELFGEIGIIVVGVLIALSAEQLVEWVHWRHQAAHAREVLGEVLKSDAIHAMERIVIAPCLNKQLDHLEAGLTLSGSSANKVQAEDTYMGRTTYRVPNRSWSSDVWDSVVADQVSSHLPRQTTLQYSSHFDAVGEMHALNQEEYGAAASLVSLSVPMAMDAGVRAHFIEIIESERQRAHLMMLYARSQLEESRSIMPAMPDPKTDPEWQFVFGPSSTAGWCRAHKLPLAEMPKL